MCCNQMFEKYRRVIAILCVVVLSFLFQVLDYLDVSAALVQPTTLSGYMALSSRAFGTYGVYDFLPDYRSLLSDRDAACYDGILGLCEQYVKTGVLGRYDTGVSNLDVYRASLIADLVLYDHPEYSPVWQGSLLASDAGELVLSLSDTPGELVSDLVYEDLVSDLPSGASSFQKLWYCVRYLQFHCSYDTDAGTHHADDYGVIFEGKACCQGLSFALKRMLAACGVSSVVLTGFTDTEGYHMVCGVCLPEFGGYVLVDMAGIAGKPDDSLFTYFAMNNEMADRCLARVRLVPNERLFTWELDGAKTEIGVLAKERSGMDLFGMLLPIHST